MKFIPLSSPIKPSQFAVKFALLHAPLLAAITVCTFASDIEIAQRASR